MLESKPKPSVFYPRTDVLQLPEEQLHLHCSMDVSQLELQENTSEGEEISFLLLVLFVFWTHLRIQGQSCYRLV